MIREFGLDVGKQAVARNRCAIEQHISHQNLVILGTECGGDNHCALDTGMAFKGGFNLGQFNPEAADFYLTVDPAQKMHQAVTVLAGQIAGAVKQGLIVTGGGNEFCRCQIITPKIAKGEAKAAGIKFARSTGGNRHHGAVKNTHSRAMDWAANGQGHARLGLGAADGMRAGKGGIFGRTIAVDHPQARTGLQNPRHPHRRHHIAAGKQF